MLSAVSGISDSRLYRASAKNAETSLSKSKGEKPKGSTKKAPEKPKPRQAGRRGAKNGERPAGEVTYRNPDGSFTLRGFIQAMDAMDVAQIKQ